MGNTAELDKDLADGLKVAKTKRCYFALVLKGGTDGALLILKTKVPAPAIAEAKKKSGGSAVVSGFVSYEDGTYVFETAKSPAATAAAAVKTIAKRDAGQTIKAIFRQSSDPELAGLDGSPEATPPRVRRQKPLRAASDPQSARFPKPRNTPPRCKIGNRPPPPRSRRPISSLPLSKRPAMNWRWRLSRSSTN